MSPETSAEGRWQRVQELFSAAVELPPEARDQFLRASCEDASMRAEVEALLVSDRAGGGFVESAIAAGTALLDAERDPLSGRARVGKYELVQRIGSGGFGAVWRGRDPLLQRSVAIKCCTSRDAKLRQRFLREAQIVAALQHPHVTTVYDFGEQDGIPYLVQELLPGEDLTEVIRRRENRPLRDRLRILRQVASALAYAHGQGVLHRDVKPSNVRILPDGTAKLMDFGIAKLLHDDRGGLTSDGVALGTIGYIAPEQLRGLPPDRRSDVFGFGVVAYELLSFERPFAGGSFSEVSLRLLSEPPPPLLERCPSCPPAVAALVERCLAKEPFQRWGGLEPVIDALDLILGALETGKEPTHFGDVTATRVLDTKPVASRGRRVAAVVLVALGAAGVVGGAAWWRGEQASRPPAVASPSTGAGAGPRARTEETPTPTASPPKGGLAEAARLPAPSPPPADESAAPAPPTETATGPVRTAATPKPTLVGRSARVSTRQPPAETERRQPPAAATPAPVEHTGVSPPPPATAPPREVEPSPAPTVAVQPSEQSSPRQSSSATPAQQEPTNAVLVPPKILHRREAVYPRRARARSFEGKVLLRIEVDARGHATNPVVRFEEPNGYGFGLAAREAALASTFTPAKLDGRPVVGYLDLVYNFHPP